MYSSINFLKSKVLKYSCISKLPKNIVLSLKRYDKAGNKINTHVKIPTTLSLTDFIDEDVQNYEYDLTSVIFHAGMNTKSGHYTCNFF